ncbi:MAG TPA: hypothetical protein PLU35_10720 [Phycisphaerales bacterium]|nr:hypothetical protein [Phycisphaerales bacterium]
MGGNAGTTGQSQGGFAKAFLPGLVLGLIIGAFAGAVIPPMLSGPPAPAPGTTGPATTPRDREEQPVAPAVEEPEEEVVEQGDQPSEEEPDGGG